MVSEPQSPTGQLAAAFRRAFRSEEVHAEEDRAESLAHDREESELRRASTSLPVNQTAARAAWFKLWLAAGFANGVGAGDTLSASLLSSPADGLITF